MNVSSLNQFFNVEGQEVIDDTNEVVPFYESVKEQQHQWYLRNRERLKKKAQDNLNKNRDEVNRKRREARATEPYRSKYLAKQRERRHRKKESGSI
jgi:predicted phosphohydrolase